MKRPILVGITGNIGSGKTFICDIIAKLNYKIYNSDNAAKKLIVSIEGLRKEIIKNFGESSYLGINFNKTYISDIVFKNKDKLKLLNSIVHPYVKQDYINWININKKEKILFKEAAILFESGSYKGLDYSILISCPEKLKIERVIKRDNTDEEQILIRKKHQWSEDKLSKLVDFIIINDEVQLLLPQLNNILNTILNAKI